MIRESLIDFFGWLMVGIWIAVSIYSLCVGSVAMFQSAGALAICAGVIYFVLQRHATPEPDHASRFWLEQQRMNLLLGDQISAAEANISILASEMVNEAEASGRRPSTVAKSLSVVPPLHIQRSLAGRTELFESRLQELADAARSANNEVLRSRRNSEILQASLVVLGTIQGGFGHYSHWLVTQ